MTSQLWNRALGACAYTVIYRCRMWTYVLWEITPCWLVNSTTLHEQTQSPGILEPEDGGNTILRNVVKYLPVDTNLQQRNDVGNQQDVTTFSLMNLFKSALHVTGDKFAHHQEHFLTVYTAFGKMHRHCCRPVPRLRWNVSDVPSQPWHRSTAVSAHRTKSCIYSQKVISRMGECRPKHVGLI